jgi:HK97 family phage prohead protease
MSELIKKIFQLKALDVDEKKKQVKVAIAQVEDVDKDEDVFDPPAFDKTMKENGPKGTNEIWHLLDHTPKTFSALSKFSELGRDGKYIAGVSNYKNSFAWREVAWPLYEAGDITQHSVGFQVLKANERDSKGVRVIKEVRLYEGSAVLWGAQPDTPTMRVVKGLLNIEDDRDITAAEKIEEIVKKLKQERKGFNDEDYSLLIIELKRLQTLFDAGQIKNIFQEPETKTTPETTVKATEPEQTTTLPDVVECPSCARFTYNTQIEKGYIKCHREGCGVQFVYGSKLFIKI